MTTTRYDHDGWNRVAEYAGQELAKTYLWAMDLSGTMQGAGGVGRLPSVSVQSPVTGNISSVHYPAFDGKGNKSSCDPEQDNCFGDAWEFGLDGGPNETVFVVRPKSKIIHAALE